MLCAATERLLNVPSPRRERDTQVSTRKHSAGDNRMNMSNSDLVDHQRNTPSRWRPSAGQLLGKIRPALGGLAIAFVAAFALLGSAAAQNSIVTIQQVQQRPLCRRPRFRRRGLRRLVTRSCAEQPHSAVAYGEPWRRRLYPPADEATARFVDAHEYDGGRTIASSPVRPRTMMPSAGWCCRSAATSSPSARSAMAASSVPQ